MFFSSVMHVHNNELIKIYSNSFFYSMCWSLHQDFYCYVACTYFLKFFLTAKFI